MGTKQVNNLSVLSSAHESYWISSTPCKDYKVLNEDISVDVAIIGGGIVGITSAYLLKEKGMKVAVIEGDKIAHGASGHTTAKITSQHNLIYHKLEVEMGSEKAKQYADANEEAIKFIANLVKDKNIDCDFNWCPAYVYTNADEYIDKIQMEVKAASSLGIKASYLEKSPLPFSVKAAVIFENQAQFHPLKYLLALAKDIEGSGSYIFEHTKVVDIERKNSIVVTDKCKKVRASKIIIASHFPCYDGRGMYFTRMYAEKSYVIGTKMKEKFPKGMFISAEKPGRSLRSQKFNGGEIVLVGGDNYRTGNKENTNIHYENLAIFSSENFNVEKILYRWSTQDYITVDSVPYVGYLTTHAPNMLVATGFGKWGMTNGTASAMILSDLITKGKSPWKQVYDPSRFDVTNIPKFISQNLDVAKKYVLGKIEIPNSERIKNGEAKVILIDGRKFGVYRDEDSKIHIVDITCTHLGCELVWNESENTWDCPCHGSRFSFDGEIIEGPAFNKLSHNVVKENKRDANIF